jgi:GTPase SAR1 family protein
VPDSQGVGVSSLALRLFHDDDAGAAADPGYDKRTLLVDGTPTTLCVLWRKGFPEQLWESKDTEDAVDIHAIVICFDISEPATLESARTAWLPKVNKRFPRAHVLLAGLKVDMRDSGDETKTMIQCISRDDALTVARSIGYLQRRPAAVVSFVAESYVAVFLPCSVRSTRRPTA